MKKIIIYAFLAWAGIILLTLLVRGFQFPKIYNYSDKDKITVAIERSMQRMLIDAPVIEFNGSLQSPAHVIPYKSVEHFLEENPDCCRLEDYDKFKSVVVVDANIFYLDDNGEVRKGDVKARYQEYFKKSGGIKPALSVISDIMFVLTDYFLIFIFLAIPLLLCALLYSLLILSAIYIKKKYRLNFFVNLSMLVIIAIIILSPLFVMGTIYIYFIGNNIRSFSL